MVFPNSLWKTLWTLALRPDLAMNLKRFEDPFFEPEDLPCDHEAHIIVPTVKPALSVASGRVSRFEGTIPQAGFR